MSDQLHRFQHNSNRLPVAGPNTFNRGTEELQRIQRALQRETARRKRLEAALKVSEDLYFALAEMQQKLVCRFLADTTLTFANKAYCCYFNRTREDLIGRSFLDLIPQQIHAAIRNNIATVCETGATVIYEHQVFGRDECMGWQLWENCAILNRDGSIRELQAVGRDITAEKKTEEARRRKESELSPLRIRFQRLTPREREVMMLVVEGRLNKQIAAETGITERTIKFHRHQIMERMQAGSLAELVKMSELLKNFEASSGEMAGWR